MKKYFYILAVLSMAPVMAAAQTLESDVDAELDQLYANQKASNAQATAPAQAQQAQPLNLNGSQPIYILNQAPSSASAQVQQSQVQKQPTTVIEASPLTESRAEQIRRSRQDAEVQTEQRIVEKLEQSRMEDEKKRASVLFGDKFNALNNQQQEVQAQPVQQVQQVQQVQAPVQVQQVAEPKENTRDIIREELASAMKSEEVAAAAPIESKYVAAMAGIADLPDVRNVKGNYSLGVAFGNKYDNFVLEGAFIYSNYTVDQSGGLYGLNVNSANNPFNVDVNQYTGQLAGKVQLFSGVIRPVLGALASYSYRSFRMTNANYSAYNSSEAKSHAIDFGALAGVDLEFNPKYSLGLDFRYMWNMSSRIDANTNSWVNSPAYGTPIEKLQYYVMSVVGRVNF
ncbi:porin family protein [Bdellovibrio svalbardensis]|uniref:Porin family protein n=1 Tax=Bdellovibrio svalbardensis TaxID=2972972 RepID=A0ABT6DKT3_9BACT|nr:hypothetical protein [Bdellovibrio svalbardensis]MDG0817477.1 porin family protein [Bdellovibrio svalbardensis]